MIEQNGYPYVEAQYGIPFFELSIDGTETNLKSASGRILRCRATRVDIRAVDMTENTELYAGLNGTEMKATLKTRMKEHSGVRHPDMYAAKFLEFALHYFESMGVSVTAFRGKWSPGSVNYFQFWEQFQKSNNYIEAARNTWSGRAVGQLGFTEITNRTIWPNVDRVEALFKKPNE